jgi:hypothetical protein
MCVTEMNRIDRFLNGEVRVRGSERAGVRVLESNSTVHQMGNIVAHYFYPIPDYDETKMKDECMRLLLMSHTGWSDIPTLCRLSSHMTPIHRICVIMLHRISASLL